jgi:hypothetical protein
LIGTMGYHGAVWASTGTGYTRLPIAPSEPEQPAFGHLSTIKPNEPLAMPELNEQCQTLGRHGSSCLLLSQMAASAAYVPATQLLLELGPPDSPGWLPADADQIIEQSEIRRLLALARVEGPMGTVSLRRGRPRHVGLAASNRRQCNEDGPNRKSPHRSLLPLH